MSATIHKKNKLVVIEKILIKQKKDKIDPNWLKQLICALRLAMEQSDLKYKTDFTRLGCFSAIETIEKTNPAQMVPLFFAITTLINSNQDIFNTLKKIPDPKYRIEFKKIFHKTITALNHIRCDLYQKIPKELL